MNRTEFMNELQRLLWDIPESERREALQYYNDYFDDAGPENEAKVIKELGSPEQVAKTIREGMFENGEYTERGYEDERFLDRQEVLDERTGHRQTTGNPWKLLSILLLCLILFPVIVPLCIVLVCILVAVIVGCIGVGIAAIVTAAVLPVIGIILVGIAFYNLLVAPAVGITLGGIGFLLLSVGILTFLLAVWACKTLAPLCLRAVIAAIRYPLRKAGVVR